MRCLCRFLAKIGYGLEVRRQTAREDGNGSDGRHGRSLEYGIQANRERGPGAPETVKRSVNALLSNPFNVYTMLSQPGLALREIRHGALNTTPERWGVVTFVQVSDLVHRNVFSDARWQQDRLPVKIQPITFTAGTPAVPQVLDFDASRLDFHPRLIFGDSAH